MVVPCKGNHAPSSKSSERGHDHRDRLLGIVSRAAVAPIDKFVDWLEAVRRRSWPLSPLVTSRVADARSFATVHRRDCRASSGIEPN
jgi:hypothetical protein